MKIKAKKLIEIFPQGLPEFTEPSGHKLSYSVHGVEIEPCMIHYLDDDQYVDVRMK
jgi:hypothetical protein